jgi:hypothetical protein
MYLETDILPKMYNAYKSLLIYTVKKWVVMWMSPK